MSSGFRYSPCTKLKGIVRPFEFGGVTSHIPSGVINWRPYKFFLNFNDTVSWREAKIPFTAALRITGMALSNQSELPVFFSPWQVNLKIRRIFLTQQFRK
jgi:hypothetical protein